MTVQEYRDYIAAGNPVVAGSEAHLPWFAEPGGELSGLIELDIEIPENHPTFNRDKE